MTTPPTLTWRGLTLTRDEDGDYCAALDCPIQCRVYELDGPDGNTHWCATVESSRECRGRTPERALDRALHAARVHADARISTWKRRLSELRALENDERATTYYERLLIRAEIRERSARKADGSATTCLRNAERTEPGSAEHLYAMACAESLWSDRNQNNEQARMYRKAAEKIRGLK